MVVVIVVIVVAVGGLGFLLVHPSGKAAFQRFLSEASGKPSPAPEPGADSAGTDTPPEEDLAPEVRADLDRAKGALAGGDFDAAQAACRQALAKAPDSKEVAALIKDIAARRAQARERERKVLIEAALRAARDLLAAGELDRAEERLNEAFAQDPGSSAALALKVKIAAARERVVRERAGNRNRADDLSHEGTQALALGDADRALRLAEQALEIDPGNMAAKTTTTAAPPGTVDVAAPAPAGGASRGQGDFEIGRICWQSGDVEGAEMYAKKALQADPAHAEAKALLAKAIETRRRLADAVARRAGPSAPRDDATVRRLAEAEKELADLKERAREQTVAELRDRLKTLEEERRLGTGAPDARDELLREYARKFKADQERAARSLADGPDTENPTDAAVLAAQYVAQADEYRKAGKFDEARAAVAKALRATPGDVEIIMLMQQIEREAVRAEVEAGKPAVVADAADATFGPDTADAGAGETLGPDAAADAAGGGPAATVDLGTGEEPTGPTSLKPEDEGAAAAAAIRLVPEDEGAAAAVAPPVEGPTEVVAEPADRPSEIEIAIPVAPAELETSAVTEPREVEGPATRRPISAQPVEIERALPLPGTETEKSTRKETGAAPAPPAPGAPVVPRAGGVSLFGPPASGGTAAPPAAPAAPTPLRTPAERIPDVPAELPASVGGVLMALAELDVALEREDIRGFERLLSERSSGGAFSGGNVSRAEEIANVREFFGLAEGVRIDRTTRPQDVKGDALRAEARSTYRISYVLEGTRMSRQYEAVYRFARERGAWRIVEVSVQAEAP
jgi:tetratricopeptide (TPR) repeat protein